MKKEGGQREQARDLVCGLPTGSLGKDCICPNLELWAVKAIGNLGSGGIGTFYWKNRKFLSRPSTDENIDAWAAIETEFFKTQPATARLLATTFSKELRAKWMKAARDKNK